MGCCGKARANLGISRAAIAGGQANATGSGERSGQLTAFGPLRPGASMKVRYVGAAEVAVRGPVTGRAYAFSKAAPVAGVDASDAAVLLRTHYFRRA